MSQDDSQAVITAIGTVIHAYMQAGVAGMIVFLVELYALVRQGRYTPQDVQELAALFLENLASHEVVGPGQGARRSEDGNDPYQERYQFQQERH